MPFMEITPKREGDDSLRCFFFPLGCLVWTGDVTHWVKTFAVQVRGPKLKS